jgi:hypothetical protein
LKKQAADLMNRHPDRFLFGTDEVGAPDERTYFKIFYQYGPLWNLLDKTTSEKVRKRNYERIFNEGRRKVRAWEQAHVSTARSQ